MFEIELANQFFDNISTDKLEVIKTIFEHLKKHGDIEGSDAWRLPEIPRICYVFTCGEINLLYDVLKEHNTIRVYGFDLDPRKNIMRMMNSLKHEWNEDEEHYPYIPQTDRPEKIIRTVEIVHQGFVNSFDIGRELGHKGKQETLKRHGSYFTRTCTELNLLKYNLRGKTRIYYLTDFGEQLIKFNDHWDRYSFLSKLMLDFKPVTIIFDEIYYGKNALTLELIQEKIEMI
ncbi:hypothetical protein GM3708_216 [Geminocystis sp. NIES-3708]|uniref:hypothetical protein n=1 Tax=Geminocystis sp. NIES-3708 TaxID=1615909 RepID=UPI0005FC71EF|nr:hypothetical protein [Geminocystis sp. NIES-3708]BAQ59810.1 hypothetical protein GM3708_216 [Geminocystis sp. NIES-3708]